MTIHVVSKVIIFPYNNVGLSQKNRKPWWPKALKITVFDTTLSSDSSCPCFCVTL